MSFQKIKDIAEIVALVAVVGSLIAVALELRQTQAALQSQTYQDRAFDAIAWHMQIATNPHLHRLSGVNIEPDDLSQTDYAIAVNLVQTALIDLDNEHFQFQNGFLAEDFYRGVTVPQIRSYAPVWRNFGIKEPRPEFRRAVDAILSGNDE